MHHLFAQSVEIVFNIDDFIRLLAFIRHSFIIMIKTRHRRFIVQTNFKGEVTFHFDNNNNNNNIMNSTFLNKYDEKPTHETE